MTVHQWGYGMSYVVCKPYFHLRFLFLVTRKKNQACISDMGRRRTEFKTWYGNNIQPTKRNYLKTYKTIKQIRDEYPPNSPMLHKMQFMNKTKVNGHFLLTNK